MTRLPNHIRDVLNEHNVQAWEIRQGGKHAKLVVQNQVVCISPHGKPSGDPRSERNVRAELRRRLRSLGVAS